MERQSFSGIGELNYIISFTPVKIFQSNIEEFF
jgi:hypothetical protein